MILIADGGSTKTDWRLISDEKKIIALQTKGLNPYFTPESEIVNELQKSELSNYTDKVVSIHYYGAGLVNDKVKTIMRNAFNIVFTNVKEINLFDDLLASARALFGDGNGIACIMGTGSNSGLYRNGVIEDKVPALGYILGDEGSGANIGIRFVNALLKRGLSKELTEKLFKGNDLSQDVILENVYKKPFPNKYLASLTKIINQHIENDQMKAIVAKAFEAFIQKNIAQYSDNKTLEIGFVGSIAYHFKDILSEIMKKYGLQTGKILRAPIDELINYHLY